MSVAASTITPSIGELEFFSFSLQVVTISWEDASLHPITSMPDILVTLNTVAGVGPLLDYMVLQTTLVCRKIHVTL